MTLKICILAHLKCAIAIHTKITSDADRMHSTEPNVNLLSGMQPMRVNNVA